MEFPLVTLDFETQSESPLRTVGAYKYSLHPSTKPTCLAFKIKRAKKVFFLDYDLVNKSWHELPFRLQSLWTEFIVGDYLFSAHNAFFERCIYTHVLVERYGWPMIPVKNWRCTAAKAAACTLPRSLEGAGAALQLSVQKEKAGHAAMMLTCKPTVAWVKWTKIFTDIEKRIAEGKDPTPLQKKWLEKKVPKPDKFITPVTAPEVFNRLYHYCKMDVLAEEAVDDALPDLIPQEQEIWHLNQALNWRGLRVDVPTIRKIVRIMDNESEEKLKELDTVTMGLVSKPGEIKNIREFLQIEGVDLPDLRAKTVDDALTNLELSKDMRRLLELRKMLSKTSTKKYHKFLDRECGDGRVRDILMYHGASTGRDTGVGVQPHNFPKGLLKTSDGASPYHHIENVIDCDAELLKLLYGPSSLGILFSAVLRNMIMPSEGYELFVADFARIEVAVCWWAADNKPGLKVLRDGKDPYIYQASANTGKPYEAFTNKSPERNFLAKFQVLGCQFGMGGEKFRETAANGGLILTAEEAAAAVASYRATNAAVPQMWKDVERAAVDAVEAGGTYYAGRCKFFYADSFLWIELPSGRRLAYREPQIAWRESDYGPRKGLEFLGAPPKGALRLERTWGGKLTENIVQAIARDIMMHAIVNLEKAGYRALLTVHDEALCEREKGKGSLDEFLKIMCKLPKWAHGVPLEADGWVGPRYRK